MEKLLWVLCFLVGSLLEPGLDLFLSERVSKLSMEDKQEMPRQV